MNDPYYSSWMSQIRMYLLADWHQVRRPLPESREWGRDLTERVGTLFRLDHWPAAYDS
jgi:hypothetical protein